MKKLTTILFVLTPMLPCSAQINSDSLMIVWNDKSKTDTLRLMAIEQLSTALVFSNPDSAISLAQLQYEFALGKRRKWECSALNLQGHALAVKSQYEEAVVLYRKSLEVGKEIGDETGMARALNNIGLILMDVGDLPEAIEHFQQSLLLKEKTNNPAEVIPALINIANLYETIGELDTAINRYRRTLEICNQVGHVRGSAYCLGNMGMVYKTKGEFNIADSLLNEALVLGKQLNDQQAIARCFAGLGMVQKERGEYIKARDFFLQCVQIAESVEDKEGIGAIYYNLGEVYRLQGDLSKAQIYAEKAIGVARSVSHAADIRNAAESLYKIYKATNSPSKALVMHELYIAMRDSIMSEENQRATIRTEFQHDMDMKDAQIKLLDEEKARKDAEARAERNKRLLTLGISASLIVILIGGAYFLQRNRKQKHQVEITRAELEKKLVENDFLRSQLDPHFIKNALYNIDRLLVEGKTEEAQRYNDRFYKLMNLTLDHAREQLIGLDEELEMMEQYLSLETDRLGNRLQWSVTVADDVNPADIELPPMILQPLVENALKHGADMKSDKGEVKLEVRVENDRILCIVEDNGGGIDLEKVKRSTSHGLRITTERLEMFSKLNLAEARLDMQNTGNGTRAVVSFAV